MGRRLNCFVFFRGGDFFDSMGLVGCVEFVFWLFFLFLLILNSFFSFSFFVLGFRGVAFERGVF